MKTEFEFYKKYLGRKISDLTEEEKNELTAHHTGEHFGQDDRTPNKVGVHDCTIDFNMYLSVAGTYTVTDEGDTWFHLKDEAVIYDSTVGID